MLAGMLIMAALFFSQGTAAAAEESTKVYLLNFAARMWCAEYHLVEENQKQARDIEPPFTQIAGDSAKSSLSIAAWLAYPHPPKLSLSQKQIGDLVAHFRSLKTD